jgi:peptidoglycan/xylan/chitin deacetylase (PgdA/CDA1 family)
LARQIALTFDFDGESSLYYRRQMPIGEQQPALDTGLRQFGPLVGMDRILDMVKQVEIPITVYIPGRIVDKYPGHVRRILAAGHEIALHGYDHERWGELSAEEEVDVMRRSIASMEKLARGPFGFRSPAWALNDRSLDILIDHGVVYDSSLMQKDTTYLAQAPSGRTLPEVPVHWSLDDWPYYGFIPGSGRTVGPVAPSELMQLWYEEASGVLEYGGQPSLTCHPQLSGRAGRVLALRGLVERFKAEGVEFVTMKQLAAQATGEPVRFPLQW